MVGSIVVVDPTGRETAPSGYANLAPQISAAVAAAYRDKRMLRTNGTTILELDG